MSERTEAVSVQFRSPNGMVIEERKLPAAPQPGEFIQVRGVTWNVNSVSTERTNDRTVVTAWVEC